MMDIEKVAQHAIEQGLKIHRDLGPGMLESLYESVLSTQLLRSGISVERQKPITIEYAGIVYADSFRIDLLLEDKLIIEVKSVEQLAPIHTRQILTYLRMARLPLGLLMNFGAPTFREGLKRVVNNYTAPPSSPLLINQIREN